MQDISKQLEPFWKVLNEIGLDFICEDLCGEFINSKTNECWCAENCEGTSEKCVLKWCELQRRNGYGL